MLVALSVIAADHILADTVYADEFFIGGRSPCRKTDSFKRVAGTPSSAVRYLGGCLFTVIYRVVQKRKPRSLQASFPRQLVALIFLRKTSRIPSTKCSYNSSCSRISRAFLKLIYLIL